MLLFPGIQYMYTVCDKRYCLMLCHNLTACMYGQLISPPDDHQILGHHYTPWCVCWRPHIGGQSTEFYWVALTANKCQRSEYTATRLTGFLSFVAGSPLSTQLQSTSSLASVSHVGCQSRGGGVLP